LESTIPPESCDFITCTFGLKTFNTAQHKKLSALVSNTLRPGGTFSFIEASDPKGWILRPFYLFHLKYVLPVIERLLLKGAQDFSMIGNYSTNFGDARQFCTLLEEQGMEAEFKSYFFGCATGVVGKKPD